MSVEGTFPPLTGTFPTSPKISDWNFKPLSFAGRRPAYFAGRRPASLWIWKPFHKRICEASRQNNKKTKNKQRNESTHKKTNNQTNQYTTETSRNFITTISEATLTLMFQKFWNISLKVWKSDVCKLMLELAGLLANAGISWLQSSYFQHLLANRPMPALADLKVANSSIS